MKIEYICHSCLYIETSDTNFVFDPWYNGSAYHNRWFVFPKPIETSHIQSTKNILITHGHEDHLHAETLKLFNKDATIFFPYQWRNGIKTFLNELGFNNVNEALSFNSYKVTEQTSVTYIGFALESVVVIESQGKVFINLNDALNSHHQTVVDMFIKEIKKRWPRIDYLFSGWSGAGYFPNTVHYKDKNDVEVGKLREQYFANHFCKIAKELNPEIAIPFAPGFVLLDKDKRWINEVKFPREQLDSYYKKYFDRNTSIQFEVMYPGDFMINKEFKKCSPYYDKMIDGSINHLVEKMYEKEIDDLSIIEWMEESELPGLIRKLEYYTNRNKNIYSEVVLQEIKFAIILKDFKKEIVINVVYNNGSFEVFSSNNFQENNKLILTTTSELLHFSLDNEWGGDALTIGYGVDVEVFEEDSLEKNLDIICVRLITRYPRVSDYLFKQPLRSAKFLMSNPMLAKLAIKQKFRLRKAVNKFPYNERDHWISFTKCELCQVCNMPLLSFEFGDELKESIQKPIVIS